MKGRFISISFLCLALFNTATYAQIQWRYFPAQLSVARSFFQALPISSSRVLVIGGYSNSGQPTNTCEIIDFDRLTVEPAAPMNEPRAEFIALLTVDSNVVVIGGKTTNGTSATVELYNRSLNTWSIIGMLNIARFQHAALCLNDHQILIVGGRLLDLSTTARAEIFDLNTGTAQMIPDYPWAMCYLRGATTSSGDHLVWGGRSGGPNSFRSNIVYAYVPQPSPSWQMYGRLAEPVYAPTVLTLQDGRILISGGAFEEAPASSFLQSTRVYLHENSSINLVGSLSMGRVWHQMVQWNTDSALIIGGQIDGIGFVATPTCEWFDLKQLSAHQAPQMNEERAFFAAVKLSPNPSRYIIAAIAGTRSTNRNTPTIEVLMNGCITEPLTITGPTTLCDGDTVTLSASDGFAQYLWSTGQNSPRIWVSKPGTYSVTATDSAGCSTSDSITISLIPSVRIRLLSNPPRSAPIATLHCDTIEVTNPSSDTLWLDDIVLARNVEWSLPQHQRPLRLLPGQRHLLVVCWYATAHGSYHDTLCIVTPCGSACLPLLLQTRPTQWRAISRCGVAVETPIEVADQGQSLLLQTPATVRVRDCLGRILLECPSDGQTASIPTASLLPGLYILDHDGSPALLLVR